LTRTILTYLWAAPASLLGLMLAICLLGQRGRLSWHSGVLEGAGGLPGWLLTHFPLLGPVEAITLGHVVLGRSQRSLELTRRHERIHVRQFERWGGLLLLAYPLAGLLAWLQGKRPYLDNRFEIEARGECPAKCSRD
jgi:hypothetical protein